MTLEDIYWKKIKSNMSHRELHIFLHRNLDELIADFILHANKLPSKTSVRVLMEWSCQQTINPTEEKR